MRNLALVLAVGRLGLRNASETVVVFGLLGSHGLSLSEDVWGVRWQNLDACST